MSPRIKLLTLYVGNPPDYVWKFLERVKQITIIDWSLLVYNNIQEVNRLVTQQLGTPCNKANGYALSDIRPMFPHIFPIHTCRYDWWGWCEIDVVFGDFDNLLPPLLDTYDAISMFDTAISGPLMLFRNIPQCNNLYKEGNWQEVLRTPSYCNFEETQCGDGGLTKILQQSSLITRWDNRFSLRWETTPAEPILAGCVLANNKLIETPTGRELLIYHFNHTKEWPINDKPLL